MECDRCHGTRHRYDKSTQAWEPCSCLEQIALRSRMRDAGIDGSVQPLSAFGRGYKHFVRTAAAYPGPSLLVGTMPRLENAARSAVAWAVKHDHIGLILTVDSLIDAAFDRDAKRDTFRKIAGVDLLCIVCGIETPHKWNSSLLTRVVMRRRYAQKATLIASVARDLRALYGTEAEQIFDGIASPVVFAMEATVH